MTDQTVTHGDERGRAEPAPASFGQKIIRGGSMDVLDAYTKRGLAKMKAHFGDKVQTDAD